LAEWPRCHPALLETANGLFKAALKDEERFARPYSNQTVVLDRKFDKLPQTLDSEKQLLDMIKEARRLLQVSLTYPASDRSQSITYNNLANWYFKECWMRLKLDERIDEDYITELLDKGEADVKEALNRRNRIPTAFITKADLQCSRLKLLEKKNKPLMDDNKKKRLDEILGYIETGTNEGYRGYEKYPANDKFLDQFDHYKILLTLGEPEVVKQRLFKAGRVGINPGH
jgi:hypothetical protein